MPLEIAAEFILKPVLEFLLELFGYMTGRVVVPLFTGGLVRVEHLSKEQRRRRTRGRFVRQTHRPRVISADAGTLCGMLFWALAALCGYLLLRAGKA